MCEHRAMKTLTLILAISFSTAMFSVPSYAEWSKIGESETGNMFYLDYDSMRETDKFVYWWDLANYPERQERGELSFRSYNQGDCEIFRLKTLEYSFFDKKWAKGNEIESGEYPWSYPEPGSLLETILKKVCSQ